MKFPQIFFRLFLFALIAASAANAQTWVSGISIDGPVAAMTSDSASLYVGGNFANAGNAAAVNIVRYGGKFWNAMGGADATVRALAAPPPQPPFALRKKSGNGNQQSILSSTPVLYAGGDFSNVGGVSAPHVAAWDGSAWTAVGGGLNDVVYALSAYDGGVYAGGAFNDSAAGLHYFALWNGTSWSSPGGGTNGPVRAVIQSGSYVYVGGDFTVAGGVTANRVARWSSRFGWQSLGNGDTNGVDGEVRALATYGGKIFVGGGFTHAGALAVGHIAAWNNATWVVAGSGFEFPVNALFVNGSLLYAGGFSSDTISSLNFVASFNGGSWSPLSYGIQGDHVDAMASFGSSVYVGGSFQSAGGLIAGNIATWSPSGSFTAFSATKIVDADGDLGTTADRYRWPWGMSLYYTAAGYSYLFAQSDSGRIVAQLSQPGTYLVTEIDSGDGWLRLNGNRQFIDTLTVSAGTAVADTFINTRISSSLGDSMAAGWNLASLPLYTEVTSVTGLFPGATSYAFQYASSTGYSRVTDLQPGFGFWLEFGSAHGELLHGYPITSINIVVQPGWNMIGAISTPVSAASVATASQGNVLTPFFSYSPAGYDAADTLYPGGGYWVKVNHAAILTIGSGTSVPSGKTHPGKIFLH